MVVLSGPVEETAGHGMLTTKAVPPFQRNLITTMEAVEPGETVQRFVQRQAEALGPARRQAAEPELVSLADGQIQGLLTEQIIRGPEGEHVRQMQLVFIRDGVAYAAIASQLDGAEFDKARDEFRSMLLSFQ